MWLEVRPFGYPSQRAAKFNAKDRVSKGMALANNRNELIIDQRLKYEVIWGDNREWSWYYQRPHDACTTITDAIQMGFNACKVMSGDPKSVTVLFVSHWRPSAASWATFAHVCRRTCRKRVPAASCTAQPR